MDHNLYLIVSDLHTTEVEDNDDGWKRYKSSKFVFDDEFQEIVRQFAARANGHNRLTLVLNGDILDFDLVTSIPDNPSFPVSRSERKIGLRPTVPKSAWKLERLIEQHPKFIRTLAEFLAEGHQIVYVLGNHDREFQFESLQDILHMAIVASAEQHGLVLDEDQRIRFEPWFYYVPKEIYVEHGQQFDAYSSFRYILTPHINGQNGTKELALPMGNLSCRHLINRLGFFNPHSSDGFILSFVAYLSHWLRHYAFSRRSLIFGWLWGSILVLLDTLKTRSRVLSRGPATHEEERRELANRVGLPSKVVEQLDEWRTLPIADKLFRTLRELWLDRLLLAMLMIGATVALALTPIPLWIKLMVPLCAFPFAFLAYEALVAESAWNYMSMLPDQARRIAEKVDCRVVAFGHTHLPMTVPLAKGMTFVNTGTWSPTWDEFEVLSPGKQNYAVVEINNGTVDIELASRLEVNGRSDDSETGARSDGTSVTDELAPSGP